MDKRTFIYVLSLGLTLFGINYYFESQHNQKVEAWRSEQKIKNAQEIAHLKEDIASHAETIKKIAFNSIFSDASREQKVGDGLIIDNALFVFSKTALPQELFTQKGKFQLEKQTGDIYQYSQGGSSLKTIDIPPYGTFTLFVVQLYPEKQIYVGKSVDSSFSLLEKRLAELEHKPFETEEGVAVKFDAQGSLKLVGIYSPKKDRVAPILATTTKAPSIESLDEKFYVLQNDYQQLVFSNQGASLVEINLPFASKKNSKSVVRPIALDKEVIKKAPQDGLFPLHPAQGAHGEIAPQEGGFYPLLRRSLYSPTEHRWKRQDAKDSAGFILSTDNGTDSWKMIKMTDSSITFEQRTPERIIRKTFSFIENAEAPYTIDLKIDIEGNAKGLYLTSGIPEVEWISNAAAPEIKYRITKKNRADVLSLSLPKGETILDEISPDWICNSNGFFGFILDPLDKNSQGFIAEKIEGKQAPSRLSVLDQELTKFAPKNLPGYQILLPLPEQGGTLRYRLFAGPFSTPILKQVDKAFSDSASGYNPDYLASQTMHGYLSLVTAPIAKVLKFMLDIFYKITHSWIVAIFLLTAVLRLALYPLNRWSMESMAKMQQIQPETKKIQDKYKNDPKKAQLELVNLYREKGINPATGCLPILIQIPFLIGMFNVLKSSFSLRGAVVIPGWINDLAAPDVLFSWETPIPFFGNSFHLLPFINGAMIYIQQHFASPSSALPQTAEAKSQARMMKVMMPVMMTLLFYNFPSGLNIYWIFSSLLAAIQQKWVTNHMSRGEINKKKK